MFNEKPEQLIPGHFPEEWVEATVLPQCQEISLYLMRPEYLDCRLNRGQGAHFMTEPLFWLFCWASGHAMARYILDHPDQVKGKQVLDFGCGSGVAAIAAARAGAKKIWACDLDPMAIHATILNSRLNSVSLEVSQDWKSLDQKVDMILAADVLYDKQNMPLLSQFSRWAPEVLVADSRVKQLGLPLYRKIASIQSVTVPDLNEPAEFGDVVIYHADQRF